MTTLLSLKQLQAGCIAGTNYATAELLAELNHPDYSTVGVTVETLTGPAYHNNVAVIAEGQPVHCVHVHLTTRGGYAVAFGLTHSRAKFVEWALRSLKQPSDYMTGRSAGDDEANALYNELAALPVNEAKAKVRAACKAGYALHNSPERQAQRATAEAQREEMAEWAKNGYKPSAAPLFAEVEDGE